MTPLVRLVIVGAGGFGPEVAWAARNANAARPRYDLVGFCDDEAAKSGQRIADLSVLGTPEAAAESFAEPPAFLCAIGNNAGRARVVARVLALGWTPVSVIDPSVIVGPGVVVGGGTYVGAGSILSPNARLGDHVLVNHHCSIGHDSRLDDFVSVHPGGRISGGCHLVEGACVASNGVVAPGRRVGRHATVGAASFAVRDVPDGHTVVGNPARTIARNG